MNHVYWELLLRMDYDTIIKFGYCCQFNLGIGKLIIDIVTDDKFWHQKLSQKIKICDDPVIHCCLAYKRFFRSRREAQLKKDVIWMPVITGYLDGVALAMFNGIDPSGSDNYAIQIACEEGYVGIVDLLLRDPRVDPNAGHHNPIFCAIKKGHIAVVRRLLQDPRLDPCRSNNYAIRCAVEYNHVAIVDLLLQDSRVEPNSQVIIWACANGHLTTVDRLLKDERVDPGAQNNDALKLAIYYGRLAVVYRLLEDMRVDPSDQDNVAIRVASYRGQLDVVDRLLEDPRVDPSAENNEAIRRATENGHFAVVNRLLEGAYASSSFASRSTSTICVATISYTM